MSEDLVSIQQRTKSFAVRVIRAYVQLSKKQALQTAMMQVKCYRSNS